LVEALADALAATRADLRGEWEGADAKLLDRIGDLQAITNNLVRELKALSASYENAQARVAELEHQLTTLTETLIASLEKHTKLLVKALPGKTARISELENKVQAVSARIADDAGALQQKIQVHSPVARSLVGQRKGAIVEVAAPGGSSDRTDRVVGIWSLVKVRLVESVSIAVRPRLACG
jgi:transcription elongation GreA/GreB family factor